MENFVNMGKQFLQNQGQGQSGPSAGQGGGNNGGLNLHNIVSHATQHDQQQGNNGNQQLFGQVASMLQNKHDNGHINENVNENQLMSAFHKITSGKGGNNQEIGDAAAVDAIKSYFGGGSHQKQGGIDSLIGKAMSVASSNASKHGGNQQDAMNHASETVMKLVMKHKLKSMLGGGGGGGDVSQLMSLLS